MTEHLLATSDLRIDRLGVPEIDGLTCETTGNHVIMIGAPESLLLATAGQVLPTRGQITIFGSRPRSALGRTELASAIFTAPLASSLTLLDYLVSSAELAGVTRARRELAARDAITRTKLDAYIKTKLARATPLVHRGAHLAAALVTGAATLVLSDPAEGLDSETARTFSRTVAQAIDDKSWIAWKAHVRHDDPLAQFANEALVLRGSTVIAQGALEELATKERTYVMRVTGDGQAAFVNALGALGITLAEIGAAYFRLTLPDEIGTRALFSAALEHGATVTELSPIAAGFD